MSKAVLIDTIAAMTHISLNTLIAEFLDSDIHLFDNQGRCVAKIDFLAAIDAVGSYICNNVTVENKRIALRMEQNYPYLITILACIKAGVAFIPLSFAWPEQRCAQVKAITGFEAEITDELYAKIVSEVQSEPVKKPFTGNGDDPLYIIFTSGSTGEPKSVEISRSAYEHLLSWIASYFTDITDQSRFLCTSQHTFDPSLMDLGLLLTRRMHFYYSAFNNNYFKLAQEIQNYSINVIATVPNNLNIVLSAEFQTRFDLSSLSHLLIGGSRFPLSLYENLRKFPSIKSYNLYGPTECTVWAFAKRLSLEPTSDLNKANITIGMAITHVEGFLVDEEMNQILKPFVKGELLLAGPQLMKGYVKRSDLTSTSIITWKGKRVYRTGDICFFDEKNEYYVVGRTNETLKRRGFRIDLVDIDSYLMKLESVSNAVTIAYPHPIYENIIVSFLILKKKEEVSNIILEAKKILAPYEMPDHFKIVNAFPLTTSAKTDKKMIFELYKDKYMKIGGSQQNQGNLTDLDSEIKMIETLNINTDVK